MKNKITQKELILRHLLAGKSITQKEAYFNYGCFRLADIIYKLKKDGYPITKVMVQKGHKSYARYAIAEE